MRIQVSTGLIRFKRRIFEIQLKQHIKCKNLEIEVITGLIRLEPVKTGLKEDFWSMVKTEYKYGDQGRNQFNPVEKKISFNKIKRAYKV